MQRRLYRSRTNRVVWGVCGGLAEYFNIDPVIIRIIAVLLIFANGIGILAYIVMAIIVPLEGSKAATPGDTIHENVQEIKDTAAGLSEEFKSTFGTEDRARESRNRGLYILGIIIIIAGVLFLLINFFGWFNWQYIWPIILVAVGILILVAARRK